LLVIQPGYILLVQCSIKASKTVNRQVHIFDFPQSQISHKNFADLKHLIHFQLFIQLVKYQLIRGR
jgi:hypothetical protein